MSRNINLNDINRSLKELYDFCKITEEEVKDRNIRVIRTQEELDYLLHNKVDGLLKQKTVRTLQINVKLEKRVYSSKYSFVNTTRSSIVNINDSYIVSNYTIVDNKSIKDTRNFSTQYLELKTESFSKEEEAVLMNKVIILVSADKKQPISCIATSKNTFRSLNTNEIYTKDELKDLAKSYNTAFKFYTPLFTTPAGDKGSSILYKLLDNDCRTEEDLANKYDKVLCGGLSIVCEEVNNMINNGIAEDTIKQYELKAITRFSAKQAPSTDLCDVNGMAVYDGTFVNITQESFLNPVAYAEQKKLQKQVIDGFFVNKKGEQQVIPDEKVEFLVNALNKVISTKISSFKANTQDGQVYGDSLIGAYEIYIRTGVIIAPIVLDGRMMQIRPVSIKASIVFVPHETFINMIKRNENKIDFYGDKNRIFLFTDKNGMKLPIKKEMFKDVKLEVLADAKISDGYSSKQVLRMVFIAVHQEYGDKGVEALIKILAYYGIDVQKEYISTALYGFDTDINDFIVDNKVSLSSVLAAKESGYYNNLILNIDKAVATETPSFIKNVCNQVGHACINNIDRCRLPLNSENRRMVADPTFIITGGKLSGILSINDCFISNPMRTTVAFFKYPIQGNREYYIFENASLKTIRKIANSYVKNNTITKEEADDIYNFYASVSDKVIVLPAFSHITFTCAGSDFDYDGCMIIYKVKGSIIANKEIELEATKDIISNDIVNILKEQFKHQGVHLGEYLDVNTIEKDN